MIGRGIYVGTASIVRLAEKAGEPNKDIDEVIEATELAGIRQAARFTPIGNIKE